MFARCLMLLSLSIALASPALAQKRIALLIGNQDYKPGVGKLVNPLNDIRLVGDSLRKVGFEVLKPVTNATRADILDAIDQYVIRLRGAGPDAIGFVYYSGHGVASRGTNYLIPVDIERPTTRLLQAYGLRLSEILSLLRGKAPNAAHYLVVDAGRHELRVTRDGKGLAAVNQQNGVLVAFAAAPGNTAADRSSGGSPYAKALAKEIVRPGVPDLLMFHRVRTAVTASTNGDQVPWTVDGIRRKQRLRIGGRERATAARPAQAGDAALQAWIAIKDSNSITAYEAFVRRFPRSIFSELARARIAQLKEKQPAGAAKVASERSRRSAAAAAKNEKWDVVPVFYGTDRVRKQGPNRINYTSERGERLEVGRALVTVPKTHEVPNIERPWVYKVPFVNIEIYREKEDPAKHFTLRELNHLTEEEFISLARARIAAANVYRGHALLFVHGFNTTFDYAVYRTAQLSYDLKFDGGSFVYSWPSRGEVSATGYTWDTTSSENAEDYLDQYMTLIAKKTGATSITVIAHSIGNKLLLPVLENLKKRRDSDIKISQVILAAPDVDRNIFTKLAQKIAGISPGITLYAAANDRALDISEQFWGGGPRAGDVTRDGPVVVSGIDTIDVTATSTEVFSLNHAGYAEKSELLGDIRVLMLTGYRKPNLRIPKLVSVPTPLGVYWKFPKAQ